MFTLADNREIGRYLAERIKKEVKSDREFVRMWIQTEMGRPAAGEEEGEGDVYKRQGRNLCCVLPTRRCRVSAAHRAARRYLSR